MTFSAAPATNTATLDLIVQSGLEITPEGNCRRHPDVPLCSSKQGKLEGRISTCELCSTEQKLEEEDEAEEDLRRASGTSSNAATAALSRLVAARLSTSKSSHSNTKMSANEESPAAAAASGEPPSSVLAMEELISRWCQLQDTTITTATANDPSSSTSSPNTNNEAAVSTTALLLLQMQKLEQRLEKQESQIESLERNIVEQQTSIQGDLTRILHYVTASASAQNASSPRGSVANHTTGSSFNSNDPGNSHHAVHGSHHHPRRQSNTQDNHNKRQQQQEIVVNPPAGLANNINPMMSQRSLLSGNDLHPSSVFTSVRTVERQPPKPPQRHDSLRSSSQAGGKKENSYRRPGFPTMPSGLSNTSDLSTEDNDESTADGGGHDKFVFYPPKMNPRANATATGRGNNNNSNPWKSRNALRNNKAQQLEIIWDASEHTTNVKNNSNMENSRSNISCNPKDLFSSHTVKHQNTNFNDSIMSGATRAFNNTTSAAAAYNNNKAGMHDSILTGVQSFMCDDVDEENEEENEVEEEAEAEDIVLSEEEEDKMGKKNKTVRRANSLDRNKCITGDDELKSSSGHSLSRFLKNTIKGGDNRSGRFSNKRHNILWQRGSDRSDNKRNQSPVIPRRVASTKKPILDDYGDVGDDGAEGGLFNGEDEEQAGEQDNNGATSGIVDDSDGDHNANNTNKGHTEIPLNLTDAEIQVQKPLHNSGHNQMNEMDTSGNDITIRTPLPQAPPTAPPPVVASSARRTSDFHPPSPPPRHRQFFPRSRGVMPTLVNSKREIVIQQGGSSRLQLSSLTLDTALPSSESGSVLREVTNYPVTDKCNERGTYTGTVNENDEPEGYGTMTYNSGAFYKGEWKEGHWHGNGILRSPDGDSYEGDFVYDCRHGRGIYKYENGDVYEGDFSSDKRHGKGTFLFQNGAMYRGDLAFGNFEGYGWYVWEEGHYEGEWLRGNYHGIGNLQYKDGSSYTGRFKDGVADGLGEERKADGTTRRGVWQDGELQQEEV